ncbi:MAG: alpha-amylase, partial [Desulfobacterales bacterium]|nr:alpha-amylase [Desulfobacterales bacterium]
MKRVTKEKAFYFFTSIGCYTGDKAFSLEDFLQKIEMIPGKSLQFHFYRGDFEKWIRDVLGYEELAETLSEMKESEF